MSRPSVSAGGGLPAIAYVFRKSREAGGLRKLYTRLRSRNACKTCALGMGGVRGGMVNEAGRFPEVCKKSVQAQAGDMGRTISENDLAGAPLERLEALSSAGLERMGRLAFPVLADPSAPVFRRIGWEEALGLAAERMRAAAPEETFFYASGRSSNEAAFLLQIFARAHGCANIHNCSSYCHAASGVGLNQVYGSGTASIVLDDLAKADLALVIGANPASNHPRLITQLLALRRRGGRVVVVNPLKELGLVRFRVPSDWRSLLFGSTLSDLYLQPHVGSDIALLKALLKGVVERGGVDRGFVREHTSGWEAVEADLARASWAELVEACGIGREKIDEAVELLLRAERGIFLWAMGLTHHAHGVDNILAVANLALARGWLGRPGSGLLPIRGHSNVQGVGSVGVTPALKQAFAEHLAEVYGIQTAERPGMDTYASMEAAAEGRIRAAVLLGGNLFASNPDRRWAATALGRIPFKVFITTKLNEGHVHGRGERTLLLPALARDEEDQPTTQESMFNFVRLSAGGTPSVAGEMRSEVEIIASLAERVLPPGRFDWSSLRSHAHLREAIARMVPGYGEIGRIERTRREFQIAGRTFHRPVFATGDGRARFHPTPLPSWKLEPGELRMMTLRSEGQFNTVVYEKEDPYRGNRRRDVVMMAAQDARERGLAEGDRVRVTSPAGDLEVTVAVVEIPAGNAAMYYPEANELVPRRLDPRSGTPAFKSVPVRVVPLAQPGAVEPGAVG